MDNDVEIAPKTSDYYQSKDEHIQASQMAEQLLQADLRTLPISTAPTNIASVEVSKHLTATLPELELVQKGDPVTERPFRNQPSGRPADQPRILQRAVVNDSSLPEGSAPTIHAPELASDRNTQVTEQNGIRTWRFESGAQINQHTEGPLRGAQILQDSHGRVLRVQHSAASDSPSHARREVEFTYGPGDPAQNMAPQSVSILDTRSGLPTDSARAQIDETSLQQTSISVTPDGSFAITESRPNYISTRHVFPSGLDVLDERDNNEGKPRGTHSRAISVAPETYWANEGVMIQQGSTVTRESRNGFATMRVDSRDGRVDHYSAAARGAPVLWQMSTYAEPTEVVLQVNNQTQTISNISFAQRISPNEVRLSVPGGSWRVQSNQFGNVVSTEFETWKKLPK